MNPQADIASFQAPIEAAVTQALGLLPPAVRPIAAHVMNAGGKRMRAQLTVILSRLLGRFDDGLFSLAAAVEMAHAASLLHDDVLDLADLRRGQPAAHTVYGAPQAILAGDALLATANRMVAAYNDPALTRVFSEGVAWTAHGEILEIEHQGQLVPLATYLDIIDGKTAWMIRMACEVGAIYAGAGARDGAGAETAPEADVDVVGLAAVYGRNLGMAFQMVDDALDFAPDTGKPMGGDLREGKYTPPLHAYVQSLTPPEQAAFAERFTQRSFDEAELNSIVTTIRAQGFDHKARELADTYLHEARKALLRLAPAARAPELVPVLEGFLSAVRHRQH